VRLQPGTARKTDLVRTPRVRIDGRLFRVGATDWYLKGFTYGPFRRIVTENIFQSACACSRISRTCADLGCNAIVSTIAPPLRFLEDALEHNIRVMIDVPWEKHRCFFEDWDAQENALKQVRKTARELGRHPGVFAISVGNEIPHDIVRFYGAEADRALHREARGRR